MSLEIQNIFWNNLKMIKRSLALDHTSFSHLFKMNVTEFKHCFDTETFPSMEKVDSFCKRIGVGFEALFSESIDLIHIYKMFYGDSFSLPSRYDYGKLSKSRTLLNCFDYLKVHYGEEVMFSFMRKLSLSADILKCHDIDININVITDLCLELNSFGFQESEIINMGAWSYCINKDSDLGEDFRKFDNLSSLYKEVCNHYSKKFDQNFQYEFVRENKEEIVIRSKISEMALDAYSGQQIGNTLTCLSKVGVFSTFSCYLGLEKSKVSKTHCIYQGDDYSQYIINSN